eukprot:444453-Amphidinium_carterae.1
MSKAPIKRKWEAVVIFIVHVKPLALAMPKQDKRASAKQFRRLKRAKIRKSKNADGSVTTQTST